MQIFESQLSEKVLEMIDFPADFAYNKNRKTGDILLVRLAPKIRYLSRALDRRVGRQQKNLKLSGRTANKLDGTESRRTTEKPVIYGKAGWRCGVGGFPISYLMEDAGVNMNYSKKEIRWDYKWLGYRPGTGSAVVRNVGMDNST